MSASGIERIAAERRRQVEVEGWTPEHDSEHGHRELARAAGLYVWAFHIAAGYAAEGSRYDPMDALGEVPPSWPWHPDSWKPSADPIRNLEKAGALIAAEIDRALAEGGS